MPSCIAESLSWSVPTPWCELECSRNSDHAFTSLYVAAERVIVGLAAMYSLLKEATGAPEDEAMICATAESEEPKVMWALFSRLLVLVFLELKGGNTAHGKITVACISERIRNWKI